MTAVSVPLTRMLIYRPLFSIKAIIIAKIRRVLLQKRFRNVITEIERYVCNNYRSNINGVNIEMYMITLRRHPVDNDWGELENWFYQNT